MFPIKEIRYLRYSIIKRKFYKLLGKRDGLITFAEWGKFMRKYKVDEEMKELLIFEYAIDMEGDK